MSTGIIVLGHGSKVDETTTILKNVQGCLRARLQSDNVRYAALQFNEPSLSEAIAEFVDAGFTDIIVLPLFITDGNHIREDIPDIIRGQAERFPSVSITVADHIGADARLTDILLDRLNAIVCEAPNGNGAKKHGPTMIEDESFRIIEASVDLQGFAEDEKAVVKRMIHASGDLSLVGSIEISDGAVEAGVRALKEGKPIVVDVRMVVSGINRSITCIQDIDVLCKVDDGSVASEAKRRGTTRSAVAMRTLAEHMDGAVVAIGNAPTALFELLEMAREGLVAPALVVGTPVGFVGAAESKEALMRSGLNYITVRGTRGGSAIAAAAVNALLRETCDENGK